MSVSRCFFVALVTVTSPSHGNAGYCHRDKLRRTTHRGQQRLLDFSSSLVACLRFLHPTPPRVHITERPTTPTTNEQSINSDTRLILLSGQSASVPRTSSSSLRFPRLPALFLLFGRASLQTVINKRNKPSVSTTVCLSAWSFPPLSAGFLLPFLVRSSFVLCSSVVVRSNHAITSSPAHHPQVVSQFRVVFSSFFVFLSLAPFPFTCLLLEPVMHVQQHWVQGKK
jgi:hypothetical protein